MLYLEPPPDAVVLCVDQHAGLQALEREYKARLPRPGKPGTYKYEYKRHGTVAVLTALNGATAYVIDDFMAFMTDAARVFRISTWSTDRIGSSKPKMNVDPGTASDVVRPTVAVKERYVVCRNAERGP